jgi:hypothetical protein
MRVKEISKFRHWVNKVWNWTASKFKKPAVIPIHIIAGRSHNFKHALAGHQANNLLYSEGKDHRDSLAYVLASDNHERVEATLRFYAKKFSS